MRIPVGSDYLGNVLPSTEPSQVLTNTDVSKPISEGISKIGDVLGKIGLSEQIELKKLEDEKIKSQAAMSLVDHKLSLSQTASDILLNPDLSSEDKKKELTTKIDEHKGKYLSTIPEQYKPRFETVFHTQAAEIGFTFTQGLKKQEADNIKANFESYTESLKRTAITDKGRAKAVEMLANYPEDTRIAAGISKEQFSEIVQKFKEDTAQNVLLKRFNDEPTQNVLKDLQTKDKKGNYLYLTDIEPSMREHFISWSQNKIEQEKKEAEREKKASEMLWKHETGEMLSEYKESKLSGLPVDVGFEVNLAKRVRGTDYERKFQLIKNQGESLGYQTEKLAKDPLTFGAAKLGVQLIDLNVNDTNTFPQQLQQRAILGRKIQESFGLTYTPLLKANEAKGLTDMFKAFGPSSTVQTLAQLKRGLGENNLKGIAKQIAVEDPQTASVIGFVAQDRLNTAYSVSTGFKYIKEKTIPIPKEDDFRGYFDKWMKDALTGQSQTRAAMYEAYKAAYVSSAATKGITSGEIDKDTAKESFQSVVGNIMKRNGKSFVLPQGFDEDKFKDMLKVLNGDIVKAAGGVYNPSTQKGYSAAGDAVYNRKFGETENDIAEVIKDDGQFYEISEGVYRVAIDGEWLQTKDKSKYFELRFK